MYPFQVHPRSKNSDGPPRILFVGESIALAHVGRPAVLAHWARLAGYETFLACGGAYAGAARMYGIQPIELETVEARRFFARLARGRFMYSRKELDAYIAAERALIRRLRPDFIVSDFRLTLPISARLEGVGLLSLMQAHWNPLASSALPALRGGVWEWLPNRVRGRLFECARPLVYRLFASRLDQARRRHGLAPLRDFRRNYTDGEYCAYLDLPELAPPAGLPDGHFFLGPLFWSPKNSSDPSACRNSPAARKLAYVTLGSTGYAPALPEVLRALMAEGWEAVVSGCHIRSRASGLAEWSDKGNRIQFVETLNPSQILKRARLTICHGGHGSVYQSLSAGVPVLGLPSNPDQQLMTDTLTNIGAGDGLSAYSVTPHRIVKKIRNASGEGCREMAQRLARAIEAFDVRSRWIYWLHQVLPLHAPTSRQTSTSQLTQDALTF